MWRRHSGTGNFATAKLHLVAARKQRGTPAGDTTVANTALDFCEAVEIGAQHVALEDEVGELAVADDRDQARGLELLDVMGEGGRAYLVVLMQRAAPHRRLARADLLQYLIAPRLRERTRNAR